MMELLKCLFKNQGLPKHQYLGDNNPEYRVKHGGGLVNLHSPFFDTKLWTYMYWATSVSDSGDFTNAVLIPEKFLEEVL